MSARILCTNSSQPGKNKQTDEQIRWMNSTYYILNDDVIIKHMIKVEVGTETLFLEGLSMQATFLIQNHEPKRAVSFFVVGELHNTEQSGDEDKQDQPCDISVFPSKGTLLPGSCHPIKIRQSSSCDLPDQFQLKIIFTLRNPYNQVLVQQCRIQPHELQITDSRAVKVELGIDSLRIKKEIEEEVHLSSTLGRDASNISIIETKRDEEFHKESFVSEFKVKKQPQSYHEILSSSLKHPVKRPMSKFKERRMEKKHIEASELLILALLAGFFFALGSKLVHLFAY